MRPLRHFPTYPSFTPRGEFRRLSEEEVARSAGFAVRVLGVGVVAKIADRRGGGLHRPWLRKYNSDEISPSQAWDHLRFRGMTSSERCVILKPSDIMKNESERRPAAPR